MTAFTEDFERLLATEAKAGRLTGVTGIGAVEKANAAVELAKPLVVNALVEWTIDAGSNLLSFVRSIGSESDQLAHEEEPARRLFGKRLIPATTALEVEAGIPNASATAILDIASTAGLTALGGHANTGLDKQGLNNLLRNERSELTDRGWGPWMEMVSRGDNLATANTVSTPLNSTDATSLGIAAAEAGHDEMTGQAAPSSATVADADPGVKDKKGKKGKKTDGGPQVPTTGTGPYRGDRWDALAGDEEGAAPEIVPTAGGHDKSWMTTRDTPAAGLAATGIDGPAADVGEVDVTVPPEDEDSSGGRGLLLVGAVGAAALLGGGLFALLTSGGGDDTTTDVAAPTEEVDEPDQVEDADEETVETTTPTQAADDTEDATEDGETDENMTDESAGQTVDVAQAEIVRIQVPMTDIKGVSPESGGVMDFEFNTVTGEICYSLEAEAVQPPFATHIHVGAEGIRGGIVVDFGENESPAAGCVENPPDDTMDILTFPGSHYAEFHDSSGAFTVRGQLSDKPSTTDDRPELAFTDPDGGGAQAVVEAGRIVLRGPVADRATADLLAAEYAALDLGGIDVIDNLEVSANAPSPSGRVVLNDAILFDVGSSNLELTDQSIIDVLVAVALSESNSTMTIVGHTDSTGSAVSNLELSLARANALRDVLVGAGVPLENLRVEGAGDTDPIGDNATDEGRALNRRIEFELKPIAN